MQHAWPQLGRALYNLECEMIGASSGLDEQQKNELRERLRAAIIFRHKAIRGRTHMPSAGNQSSLYQRPAELLQELIRFDTTNPPGNEAECISYINYVLTEAGFQTTILARDPMRPNLIARLTGQRNVPACRG